MDPEPHLDAARDALALAASACSQTRAAQAAALAALTARTAEAEARAQDAAASIATYTTRLASDAASRRALLSAAEEARMGMEAELWCLAAALEEKQRWKAEHAKELGALLAQLARAQACLQELQGEVQQLRQWAPGAPLLLRTPTLAFEKVLALLSQRDLAVLLGTSRAVRGRIETYASHAPEGSGGGGGGGEGSRTGSDAGALPQRGQGGGGGAQQQQQQQQQQHLQQRSGGAWLGGRQQAARGTPPGTPSGASARAAGERRAGSEDLEGGFGAGAGAAAAAPQALPLHPPPPPLASPPPAAAAPRGLFGRVTSAFSTGSPGALAGGAGTPSGAAEAAGEGSSSSSSSGAGLDFRSMREMEQVMALKQSLVIAKRMIKAGESELEIRSTQLGLAEDAKRHQKLEIAALEKARDEARLEKEEARTELSQQHETLAMLDERCGALSRVIGELEEAGRAGAERSGELSAALNHSRELVSSAAKENAALVREVGGLRERLRVVEGSYLTSETALRKLQDSVARAERERGLGGAGSSGSGGSGGSGGYGGDITVSYEATIRALRVAAGEREAAHEAEVARLKASMAGAAASAEAAATLRANAAAAAAAAAATAAAAAAGAVAGAGSGGECDGACARVQALAAEVEELKAALAGSEGEKKQQIKVLTLEVKRLRKVNEELSAAARGGGATGGAGAAPS